MNEPITYQEVLSLFKETDKQFKETDKKFQETDKKFQETDKQIQETRKLAKELAKESMKEMKEIREMFKETDKQIQETGKLAKEAIAGLKDLRELFKETDEKFSQEMDRIAKESEQRSKELDKRFKETDKKLRKAEELFTGQWGKLMESLVRGDLVKLLNLRNIHVNQTTERTEKMYQNKQVEIDIIAKNGKEVVFVEVKTTLRPEHIENFIEKLNKIKEIFPEYLNNTVYGAVAYLRPESESQIMAMKRGLLVIRATGNSASIINSEDFCPVKF